ncbi:MAG: hypothetical protein NDI84_09320, partial [Steroidobacteraceae bacterium]|nr:hypothetical protein [Steroidobacteraceae bacterium]
MSIASLGKIFAYGWLLCAGCALAPGEARAAVGSTDASFGVSATGAASYVIPVPATEGIGGLTPQLSIRHAGADARGILGAGMTVAGLSSIAPCRRTLAQDGAAGPIQLQSADKYCIDGARLRLVSGTYGASGAVYQTELEQFARITSYDAADGQPGWFKVETRDGLIHEYGHSTDAVLRAGTQPSSPIQLWAVSSIRDRSGNAIVFRYQNDSAARLFRPDFIRYTDSALAGSGRYTIRFTYQTATRPDLVYSYTPSSAGGASRIESGLLERIELRHDEATYRQLLFSYETGAGSNTRLHTVQTCAASSSDCFPATTFTWQSATAGHAAPSGSAVVDAWTVVPLDINGDGFEDLAWRSGTWWTMLGGASGYGAAINTGVTAVNPYIAMPLDWNGDGRGDLLIDWSDGKWRVLTGTATGFAAPVQAGPGAGIPSNTANSAWWLADVDGDGRDDLLRAVTTGAALVYVRLNSASGYGSETLAYSDANLRFSGNPFPPTQSYRQSVVRRPDFDGDGRTDLLLYACTWDSGTNQCLWTGWFELTANGTGFTNRGNVPGATYNIAPLLGHFNADALTDVVFPAQGSETWCMGFSQGGMGFAFACGPGTTGYWTFVASVADYDGDGYDDVYAYAQSPADQWHVLRSTGTGIATTPIATGMTFTGSSGWAVSDPTGDGLPDLGAVSTGTGTWQTRAHLGVPGERLANAVDGFGVSATFSYAPLTDATVHTKYANAAYPTQDLQRPWWVVKQVTATDGSGAASDYTQTYSYEGARRDVNGRGFLGFAKRISIDGRLGYNLRTEESYSQAYPYIGLVSAAALKQSGGTSMRQITNTWSALTLGAGYEQRRYPYLSNTYDQRYEVGGPQNGQLHTQVRRWVSSIDSTSGLVTDGSTRVTEVATGLYTGHYRTEREQHTSVLNDTTNWCLGRPQTTLTTASHTLTGGTAITRTTGQTWDSVNCRLQQRQLEPGHAQWQVTLAYGYDGFGNRSSESVTGIGMSARTRTLNYGTRGQRPEQGTDPMGHGTAQGWDYALGVLSSATDPNGLTTAWSTDSFGRRTLETRPDQTRTAWDRTACASGCDPRTRYRVTTSELDAVSTTYRTTVTDYDQFERAFQSATQMPGGASAVASTERDARGRVTRQYAPHWSGNPHDGYTQFAYDMLDRVTSTDSYTDSGSLYRSSSSAYNGLSVTGTNPRGYSTTEVRTAWGDRMRVTDGAGNHSYYRYDAFGNLTRLIDPLNHDVRILAYNLRGAQTSEVNLNRGTTTLVPNALGELVSATDAKGQTRTHVYDNLGRMTSRSEPEGTTSWTWGSSASSHNIGRLATVAGPGLSESYGYDGLGRPVTRSITSDATYQYDYAYNGIGRLDTLTYPTSTDGYRLKLAYEYQYGELSRIKDYNDPNTVPWQLNAMDAAGRVLDETLGADVRVVSGFNATTGRLSSRQAGVGGGSGIQNLSYWWDVNDNLIRREDGNQAPPVYEYFYYDNLDRIDYSQRNGVTNVDVAYDALGNLTSKSDVGSYTYDATKIHAVTAAGANSYAYDANGNMTSRNGSTVIWTSYDLPNRIDNGTSTVSYMWYGPDRRLWRQQATTAGVTETTTYVGDVVEKVTKDGVTTWKHYVEAPTGTAAVYLRRSDGTASTYYLTHDHLGSTDKVLDAQGAVVAVAESFTALGARRGSSWQGTPTPAELAAIAATTRVGFTGHVMLDNLELVHMGGRVYDPVIGRFLSVDPVVRDTGAAQSWNSYGYVEGRVVSAIDSTGYALDFGDYNGLENVIVSEQRDPCGGFGILCNVNVGWDLRTRLQSWGLGGESPSSPGGGGAPTDSEEPQGQTRCTNDGDGSSILDHLPSVDPPSLPDGFVDFSAGL